jgi:hypothetical protein
MRRVAEVLRDAGHDVVFVQDIEPGADDGRVMALATTQDRLLATRILASWRYDRFSPCRGCCSCASRRSKDI